MLAAVIITWFMVPAAHADVRSLIVQKFKDTGMGESLITVLIAMLPIIELRGAIPVAVAGFHMPWIQAYLLSVVGNMIPVLPVIMLIQPIARKFAASAPGKRFFDWLFARARKKGKRLLERYEVLGLMIFVAIPLPVTGAWTGSVIASLFDLKISRSFRAILYGVLIAGFIVMLLTQLGLMGYHKSSFGA